MVKRKVKIKVKKKVLQKKKIIITLFLLLSIIIFLILIINMPLKNIYINGNKILSDKEIINIANLNNYPSYLKTYFINIKDNLLNSEYIKNVKIKRKIFNKIYIEIEEYYPICRYEDKVILSSSKKTENTHDIKYVPFVVNDIDNIYDEFVNAFIQIDENILLKISHIEYSPNDVDKERFLLYMVDSNYVYITLSKIEKLNKYNLIVKEIDGKKGIIYLDLGDYIEIKG